MRKAFTLIEVVVSLGILAVILSFAGTIFKVSVESQRTAMANAEVMQKLRIITEQLDADFKGAAFMPSQAPYSYDGYVSTRTATRTIAGKAASVNSDALVIFTCGDFRSTDQYRDKTTDPSRTIAGNVACVFYGQPDPNSYRRPPQPYENVLLRRQTILVIDGPASGSNALGEYFDKSPQEVLADSTIKVRDWIKRPVVDVNDPKASLPMLVARGVDDFTISYLDASRQLRTGTIPWVRPNDSSAAGINAKALKFTFTLYDSKGVLKRGRAFTHIVVWDN